MNKNIIRIAIIEEIVLFIILLAGVFTHSSYNNRYFNNNITINNKKIHNYKLLFSLNLNKKIRNKKNSNIMIISLLIILKYIFIIKNPYFNIWLSYFKRKFQINPCFIAGIFQYYSACLSDISTRRQVQRL